MLAASLLSSRQNICSQASCQLLPGPRDSHSMIVRGAKPSPDVHMDVDLGRPGNPVLWTEVKSPGAGSAWH